MDDIFQKALSGSKSAVKGLYVCSVSAAYSSVFVAVGDEKRAVEIVEEAYLAAFSAAKTYEEFFTLLNKRALTSSRFAKGKNVEIQKISAVNTVFDDLSKMPVPDELKSFADSLCAIVLTSREPKNFKLDSMGKHKKHSAKEPDADEELKEFAESIKKREFSALEKFKTPKEPEPEKPKTLAQKLKSAPPESSEQLSKEQKEREKNKRAAIISFIFAAVIFAGALSTFFITRQIREHNMQKMTNESQTQLTVPHIDKVYKEGEQEQAFKDYLNEVLVPKLGVASKQKIVVYNETSEVGAEQLNGIVSAKSEDIDGDGQDEFMVVALRIRESGNFYTYSFYLYLYKFEEFSVAPVEENYKLIEYGAYNRGMGYELGEFNLFLRLLENDGKKYLYAEGSSESCKICSYHYFENEKLNEGQRLVYFAFDDVSYIYLQRRLDGTFEPLYCVISTYAESDTAGIPSSYKEMLKEHGLNIGNSQSLCENRAQLVRQINLALLKTGLVMGMDSVLSFDSDNKSDYICYYKSLNEQGDMLSRQTVAQIKDFTDSEKIIKID